MSIGIGREGKHWTAKEDAALLSLAYLHGRDWRKVAAIIGGGRNPGACQSRYVSRQAIPTRAEVVAAFV
jgi:Myb-like DNA-binding domain